MEVPIIHIHTETQLVEVPTVHIHTETQLHSLPSHYLVLSFQRWQDGGPDGQPMEDGLEVDAQAFLPDLFGALRDWLLGRRLVLLLHLLLGLGRGVVGLVHLLPFAVCTQIDSYMGGFSKSVTVKKE